MERVVGERREHLGRGRQAQARRPGRVLAVDADERPIRAARLLAGDLLLEDRGHQGLEYGTRPADAEAAPPPCALGDRGMDRDERRRVVVGAEECRRARRRPPPRRHPSRGRARRRRPAAGTASPDLSSARVATHTAPDCSIRNAGSPPPRRWIASVRREPVRHRRSPRHVSASAGPAPVRSPTESVTATKPRTARRTPAPVMAASLPSAAYRANQPHRRGIGAHRRRRPGRHREPRHRPGSRHHRTAGLERLHAPRHSTDRCGDDESHPPHCRHPRRPSRAAGRVGRRARAHRPPAPRRAAPLDHRASPSASS